jgi:hypothetical protein
MRSYLPLGTTYRLGKALLARIVLAVQVLAYFLLPLVDQTEGYDYSAAVQREFCRNIVNRLNLLAE